MNLGGSSASASVDTYPSIQEELVVEPQQFDYTSLDNKQTKRLGQGFIAKKYD